MNFILISAFGKNNLNIEQDKPNKFLIKLFVLLYSFRKKFPFWIAIENNLLNFE